VTPRACPILVGLLAAACGSKEVEPAKDFFATGSADNSQFAAGLAASNSNKRNNGSGSAESPSGSSKNTKTNAEHTGSGSGSAAPKSVGSAAPVNAASIEIGGDVTAADIDLASLAGPAPGRDAVKPSADLAAIKLTLDPGWVRDHGEEGSLSYYLSLASRGGPDTLFSFHYGIEKPGAPKDRDAYKAWLTSEKIMTVTRDRQRGAAWFLEGTDSSGVATFRYQVRYGGKFLICGGSLYKDAESLKLGKYRDAVVIAAEKICESVTL
jgi:hypothetical protein